jgi:hypothetical protein
MPKANYSNVKGDIFYKNIYPVVAKDFFIISNYEQFASVVSSMFILNVEQWEYIYSHWEEKEAILNAE